MWEKLSTCLFQQPKMQRDNNESNNRIINKVELKKWIVDKDNKKSRVDAIL